MATKNRAPLDLRAVLRDSAIVVGLLLIAGVMLAVLAFVGSLTSANAFTSIVINILGFAVTIVLGATGFALSARSVSVSRWKHMSMVALIVWLVMCAASFSDSVSDWISDALHVALMMVLGGVASYFVNPLPSDIFRDSRS